MRWCGLWSLIFVLLSGIVGCGAAQDEPTVVVEPPPPPQPQAEPRVWDSQSSYDLGFPIAIKIGIVNTGETIVNAPSGDTFGIKMRARRALPAPPAPPEPPPAEVAEATPPVEGEGATPVDPNAQTGDATPAEPAAPAEPSAPPPPQFAEIDCQDIPVDANARYLTPLATSSNTYRRLTVDALCAFDEPGRYFVELTVVVPEIEGGDVAGELEPVTLELEIRQPDPPIVGRLVLASREFEVGQPIEAIVRVTNWGEEVTTVIGGRGLQVELAAESQGESVPCSGPGRRRGARPQRLERGQSVETTVDIADRCQLTLAGTYTITPQVIVQRAGGRSFHGTLTAPFFDIELTSTEEESAAPVADMVMTDSDED